MAPAADPQSRTYRFKLTLVQPAAGVRLGMTGDATLSPATDAANTASANSGNAAVGNAMPDNATSGKGASGNTAFGMALPGNAVRGHAAYDNAASGKTPPGNAAGVPTFTVPATAIFHDGREPAVWVIRAADSTLELRPVTVASYSERTALVSGGLKDGDNVVLAGVHTVYAGQRVKPVKPLFDGEGAADAAQQPAANARAGSVSAAAVLSATASTCRAGPCAIRRW